MPGRARRWTTGVAVAASLWAATAPAFADSVRSGEWPLDAQHFQAERVWASSRGAGVTVAVVDSGVFAAHPDLEGQVLPGTSLLGDGGDGRTDTSGDSHGTAIAGIIAGTGGADGNGMTGLAPDAKILPVRIASGEQVLPSAVAQGIVWATDHGAQVINVSLGAAAPDPLLKQAVAYALRKNVVLVAAAGNQGGQGNSAMYPAAFPGVVSVSGTNSDGTFWAPSESGHGITIAAPASDIYSTNDTGQYVHAEGTSYAAAYVSATAALIRSHQPELTAGQVIQRLTATTKNHHERPDAKLGYGILDPLAAVTADVRATSTGNPLLADTASAASSTGPTSSPALLWGIPAAALLLPGAAALAYRRKHRRTRSERNEPPTPVPRVPSQQPKASQRKPRTVNGGKSGRKTPTRRR